MEINERSIKITGTANIPQDLVNGNEYAIAISNAEVRNVSEAPTDDGKVNKMFSLKLSAFSEVNIVSNNGVVTGKVKGTNSVALRKIIERGYDLNQPEGFKDKEDYYNYRMSQLIDQEKSLIN